MARSLCCSRKQVEDLVLDGHVERRGRLVGEQHPRAACESDRDADALAHAARHLVRVDVEALLGLGDVDRLEERDRDLLGLLLAHVEVIADVLGQLAPDGDDRVERRHRVLEDHGHLGAPQRLLLLGGLADQFFARVLHRSGRVRVARRVEPHDRPRQHRLARTRLADHAQRAAACERERHAVDGSNRTGRNVEVCLQVVDDQQRLAVVDVSCRRSPDADLVCHASPFHQCRGPVPQVAGVTLRAAMRGVRTHRVSSGSSRA